MLIEQIEIKNYRVLRDVKLAKLPRMAIIVGANGTGKSTLFDVFSFLKESVRGDVACAVTVEEGFANL